MWSATAHWSEPHARPDFQERIWSSSVGRRQRWSEPRAFSWERRGDFIRNSGDGSWAEYRWETKVARLPASQDRWESQPSTQPSPSSRRHENASSTRSRTGQLTARSPVSVPPMSEAGRLDPKWQADRWRRRHTIVRGRRKLRT